MKQLIYLCLVLFFASCGDRTSAPFVVEGKLAGGARMVYLERSEPDGSRPVVIDSGAVTNGAFRIQTAVDEQMMLSLRADAQVYPFAFLINDSRKINVEANLSAPPGSRPRIEGSDATTAYLQFDSSLQSRIRAFIASARTYDSVSRLSARDSAGKRSVDSVQRAASGTYETAYEDMKAYTLEFLGKANNPVLFLYALQTYQGYMTQMQLPPLTALEQAGVVRPAAQRFPNNKALADLSAKLPTSKAAELAMTDTAGQLQTLSSLKGKWVLVDFWASWCRPCRAENPNVVQAYNRFKDKNFTILGVSLDQDRSKWIEAIQADGLTWPHISDLKQWNSAAVQLYGFTSIPYNVLVDPNGNIVAENLRGEKLQSTLAQWIK